MLKQKLLLVTQLFCICVVSAQQKSSMKLGIEPGIVVLSDTDKIGIFLNIEPKINVSENIVVGLRIGASLNSQKFEHSDNAQFNIDKESDNGIISFVPAADYYFNKDDFRPYLGLGLGLYILSDIDVSRKVVTPAQDFFEVSVKNQVGVLLRGGFELNKLRFGLEYNFIPKADIKIPNGQKTGMVSGSYFGLSFGFTIGERNSSK